jgi:uncharacterized protein
VDARVVAEGEQRTWVVVPDRGTEAVAEVERWARDRDVAAAQLTAIGGFERATVGWFEWSTKDYRRITVDEQCEVVSLVGDLALVDDGVSLHAHVTLGLSDGTARVGHLLAGIVRPTLEIVVVEAPAHLHRRHDPTTGLALLRP